MRVRGQLDNFIMKMSFFFQEGAMNDFLVASPLRVPFNSANWIVPFSSQTSIRPYEYSMVLSL